LLSQYKALLAMLSRGGGEPMPYYYKWGFALNMGKKVKGNRKLAERRFVVFV